MVKRVFAMCVAVMILFAAALISAQAETLRKRYTFPYNRATRKASSMVAEKGARKRFLRDFLAEKLSPEITSRLEEEIDIALDPPDQYLSSFNVISERTNEDETQVTVTVEGEVDLPLMITALVQNKVLSFGKESPKVMVLPSSRFDDPKAAKTLRALMYDRIKEAGLRPVAFESASSTFDVKVKRGTAPGEAERKALIRQATQYGADYLIYIDAEVETRPFSQGGFISDANFIYTILRPNGGIVLGESVVSERGSGSSAMLAFDRALDSVAPVIARLAIGQLYEAIYSDSDVIYNTPKLREEKSLVIHGAPSPVVQAIIEQLEKTSARATLTTGMSEGASRLKLETEMDDLDLYEWFNKQRITSGGKVYKTPVVAYSENVIEIEAVAEQAKPRRQPVARAPVRKAPPKEVSGIRPIQTDLSGQPVAKVTLKLRPAQFNR
ncbi:MAG TPA: hypothetical protein VNO14_12575 [Blastocatellia bacterium]|nr:hypothetical protein [Blastocatellia bacterium]